MMNAMQINDALELVATIAKRCEIVRLIALQGSTLLLPTALEDILEDMQELSEFCCEGDDDI